MEMKIVKKDMQRNGIMTNYIVSAIVSLAAYGIIISKVKDGRCFRFEFLIKKIIIYSLLIIIITLMIIEPYFFIVFFIYIFIFFVLDTKYTIQRLYDLNVSGWHILLLSIPVINTLTTLALFFTKGNCEINNYDKAVNYDKIFKHKRCINIYDRMFIIDNEEYQYEKYLGKYTIKISKYKENNNFTDYLYKNYKANEEGIYKTIEITSDEFKNIIKDMDLIVVIDSFYVNINEYQLFIRKEDFKYTIIINKNDNNITDEMFEIFNFPGLFYEDEKYIYYNKINKNDLLKWVKHAA
jgi:uncharacterized membrane protein YhaH (DUF805 family)